MSYLYTTDIAAVYKPNQIQEAILQAQKEYSKGKYVIQLEFLKIEIKTENKNEERLSRGSTRNIFEKEIKYQEVTETQANSLLSPLVVKIRDSIPEFV